VILSDNLGMLITVANLLPELAGPIHKSLSSGGSGAAIWDIQ